MRRAEKNATNSFCLRDESSCEEDERVNPLNPGGGMFTKLHSDRVTNVFLSNFCPSSPTAQSSLLSPDWSEVIGVRLDGEAAE